MSKEIDQKVVEMQFDNKNFEKNVAESMSTLDKLKAALDFSGSSRGFENITDAAGRVNMSPLSSAVETIQVKFSALETVAITALVNITNSAIESGKKILSSLTIDNISAGWEKFGQKTTSVSTLVSQGYALEDVNTQLERLNWFTDETSYNFTDMVSEIAKFTASGQSLEDSVSAMEGIANWAALSGQNASTASRAMYQLSQAMGKGALKLDDWKSIQNASMDTIEFRQNAVDAAVELGVLKKLADGTYASIDADIQAEGATLNDLFTSDWLTKAAWLNSDVMMKTFKQYSSAVDTVYDYVQEKGGTASDAIEALGDNVDAFGLKAFRAAQEARTWADVLDSVKDAVSTGWMNTFQNIFGDYEEAKTLWTDLANELWDVFASGAEQRNEMLAEWKNLGGRDLLFANTEEDTGAFWNVFYAIKDALDLLKEAFHEVIPPMTAEKLIEITENFKSLTEKFKMSDETSTNLKNTFKGLFSAIDLVARTIGAVFKGFEPLVGLFGDIAGGLLGITGSFGDWLSQVDQSAKDLGVFETITEKVSTAVQKFVDIIKAAPSKINEFFKSLTGKSIGEALEPIAQKIKDAFGAIGQAIHDIGTVDTSGINNFVERVKTRFQPLTVLLDGLKSVFSAIWKVIQKLSPLFAGLATAVGKALGALGDAVSKSIEGADFNTVLDIVNGGLMAGIGVGLKKFVDSLQDMTSNVSGTLGSFKKIFEGVTGCLETMQASLKADALLKIAAAIGIITVAIVALTLVDSDKLGVALAAITGAFLDLFAAMGVFTKTLGGSGMKGATGAATAMLVLSAAVLVLSDAMIKLSSLSWEELAKGISAVTALMAVLIVSAKELSKQSGKLISTAAGLVIFAKAIQELTEPVVTLGAMDLDSLGQGLLGLGVMLGELMLFLNNSDMQQISITKGLGMMALAEAIKILADAVSKFAAMTWEQMIQGLVGVAAVLAEIVGFTKLMGDSKSMILTATGLVILGAAMNVFASAVEQFGNMSWEELGKGLLGMGTSLAIVAVAMNNMPKDILLTATGLVLVGAALNIIASALTSFADMTWEEIAKGLVTLAGSLTVIAVAVNAMSGAMAGAAAMLVVSAALAILAPVLKSLGNMSWESIAKGLIALAGAFAIIGVAGAVLAPIVPSILALAGAIALIGVGIAAAGAGLLMFAAGLGAIAVAGTGAAAALVIMVEAVLSLIPEIFVKVGEAIIALCNVIAEGAPAIGEAVKAVVLTLVDVLVTCLPALVDGALQLISKLLEALVQNGPSILSNLFKFIVMILDALAEYVPQMIDSLVNLLINVVNGLAARIPDISDAVVTFVTALFGGLVKIVGGLIGNFIGEIANGIATAIADGLPHIGEKLSEFSESISPFLDMTSGISEDSMRGVKVLAETILLITAAELLSSVGDFLSIFTGSTSSSFGETIVAFGSSMAEFAEITKDIDSAKVEGAANAAKALAEFANSLPKEGGLWQAFVGEGDLAKFGEELEKFGPHFAAYAQSVSSITNTDAVIASATAAKALADFANNLPKHDGIWQDWVGDSSLTSFAQELSDFAPALVSYAKQVEGLNAEVVVNSVTAATALRDFAANLPAHDGIWQSWVGDASLTSFARELESFAPALMSYAQTVDGLDAQTVTDSVTAAEALSALANGLPDSGGLVSWFAGDNTLEGFSKGLPILGQALHDYANNLGTSFDPSVVVASVEAARALSDLESALPDSGGIVSWFAGDNTLSQFASGLADFGLQFSNYYTHIQNVDPEKVKSVVEATSGLVELCRGMGSLDTNGMKTFSQSLKNMGETGLNEFVAAFDNGKQRVTDTAVEMINTFDLGILSQKDTLKYTFETMVDVAEAELIDRRPDFSTHGTKLMEMFIEAITNKNQTVMTLFHNISGNGLNKIKNRYPEFKDAGTNIMSQFINGVQSKQTISTSNFVTICNQALTEIRNKYTEFYNAGVYLVDGFANGITAERYAAEAAARAMAKAAADAAKNELDINSPSRVGAEIGAFFGQGFVDAILGYSENAFDSGIEMGAAARDGLNRTIADISRIIESDIDAQPTIRPVLDLSNVSRGASTLNGLFSSQRAINLAGATIRESGGNGNVYNTIRINNDDVVSAIDELRDDMGAMTEAISQLQVVMDTGAVVGALTEPMNNSLGQQAIRQGRGIK